MGVTRLGTTLIPLKDKKRADSITAAAPWSSAIYRPATLSRRG
jgi:hypothetical protein